jgi:AraC family transcriptional regulator of adaptative response/methylated-DNA-[protein]-cysteine methyltransferase
MKMSVPSDYTDEESRWTAVAERDRTADGAFFYAVVTTGVFCRPGCSSRKPRRKNVEFFDTGTEAKRAGYRPCNRCKPDTPSQQDPLTPLVVRACRRIEEAETPPSLTELAEEAGLSPSHFHRVFKKVVGITPKKYATTHQAKRFRASLANGATVTAAAYDAGYSSSGRAHENSRAHLAMTPSSYRNGAKGELIQYGVTQCSLGWLIVAATDRGVCDIEFGDDTEALVTQLRSRFPEADIQEAEQEFAAVVAGVVAYIEEPDEASELPLDIRGTAFQEQVWNSLRDVPRGTTVSYAELAGRIGCPKAVRAVAQACAANKLAVAIPCHRAVRSDGSLSGYRWGVARKRALLAMETKSHAIG